jgi:hypothetical protein
MPIQRKKEIKNRIYSVRIDDDIYEKINYIKNNTKYNIDIARSFRSMIYDIYDNMKSEEKNQSSIYPEI